MSTPIVNIHVVSSGLLSDDVLMLGAAQMKLMNISAGQQLTLRFGAFHHYVMLMSVPRFSGLKISQTLARRIGLYSNATLRLRYDSTKQQLKMGPLIGVLLSSDYPESSHEPFGEITMFCHELSESCQKQGAYVYFFTPSKITANYAVLEGWVFSDGWHRLILPTPDVVNNRLITRKVEKQENVQQFLTEIQSRFGSQVFNEKFLDKTEVFQALKNDAACLKYLPESHALKNFAMFKQMCLRYNSVFLKPITGSLGRGIIRISRLTQHHWQMSYSSDLGTKSTIYTDLTKVFHALKGKMKRVRYLIQQGLNVISFGSRPIDFRSLTQKDGSGKWAVTSTVGRTAGLNQFVSNLARGGTISTVKETIMRSDFPLPFHADLPNRLSRAALQISNGIDTYIPAHFAELGIDLAVDKIGRLWLLEVNSKPSKRNNTPLKEGKIRPSVRMLIQYARYISGF